MAEDLVADVLRDAGAVGGRERRVLGLDDGLERLPHPLLEVGLLEVRVVQLRSEAADQRLVDALLHPGVGVDAEAGGGDGRQDPFSGTVIRTDVTATRLFQTFCEAHASLLLRNRRVLVRRVAPEAAASAGALSPEFIADRTWSRRAP